ncbi:thioredoxin family protein [Paenibacillus mesotrionivorans]|uniref:Thioredoxin family protein n=1 Tax=Paenibacillus mesotrionivorans TaxID=3160968 RepID=A0ACC7NVI3_9BACL
MKEVHSLSSLDMVESFLQEHQMSFLYVSRPECTVCHAILPKLRELLGSYPKIQLGHINANQVEAVVGHFSVFAVPTMLMMIEQKEYARWDRFVRFDLLNDHIKRVYEVMAPEG